MGKQDKRRFAFPFLIILFSFASTTVMAASPCKFVEEATLPANFKDGGILVDVAVNGTPAKFRIGTHSPSTQISRSMAQRLHLPHRQRAIMVSQFKIGEKVSRGTLFGETPEGGDGTTDEFAGVVGRNYLSNFDIEIDPALGRVNLFAPIECPADAAYWASEHFELPVGTDLFGLPRVRITLDGQEFDAYLDTATFRSTIDAAVAKFRLNLPENIDAPQSGEGQSTGSAFAFKELVFGPITIRNPPIKLQRHRRDVPVTSPESRMNVLDAPAVIGMDIIGKFHSMLSTRNGMLYFTLPNERLSAAGAPSKD